MPVKHGVVLVVTLILAAGSSGCDRLLGTRIDVTLRRAAGVRSGDVVYLAGIPVGTTGAPLLRAGLAVVPAYVRDMTLMPKDGMVFLLSDDTRTGRRSLTVIAVHGAVPHGDPPLYQGATNELELAGLAGAAEARKVLQGMADWTKSVTR
jgi:hypothetical protein